jgi:hypothetical protein
VDTDLMVIGSYEFGSELREKGSSTDAAAHFRAA